MMRATGPGWRLLLAPLIPYLLSFVIPFRAHDSVEFGLAVFQNQLCSLCHPIGWSKDVDELMAAISWLANPLLWMGYLAMVPCARYAVAILFGLAAVILALILPSLSILTWQAETSSRQCLTVGGRGWPQ